MDSSYLGVGAANLGVVIELELVRAEPDDPNVRDFSQTLSFVPGMGKWVSFHSYTPHAYLRWRGKLLGTYPDAMYVHGEGKPGRLPVATPSYVEGVVKSPVPVTLSSVSWISKTEGEDSLPTDTFDKILITNSRQASGEVALTDDTLALKEGVYHTNAFRDMTLDPKKKVWNEDGSLNTANLDVNKPWYIQRRFTDFYHLIRLTWLNTKGNSVYLYDLSPLLRESPR